MGVSNRKRVEHPTGRGSRGFQVLAAAAILAGAVRAGAQNPAPTDCNAASRDPVLHVTVQASPFEPVATADGCWIFVTVTDPQAPEKRGVTVLKRSGGQVTVGRTVPIRGNPTGAVLTHNGSMLIVAAGQAIAFLDVAKLKTDAADPVMGYLDTGEQVGFIYVDVTKDDRVLFAAAERAASVAVIDLDRIRGAAFDTVAIINRIKTGNAPVGLAFSPDDRFLYTTAQAMLPDAGWKNECRPEGQADAAPNHTQGALFVIDVMRARRGQPDALITRLPAGCNPVRVVLSPNGANAYVTARGENNLVVFDTRKMITDTAHAIVAKIPAGVAPVGVAVIEDGRTIVLTNSNRFNGGPNDAQPLTIVDATRVAARSAAVRGTIQAGAFPRELRVTADGKTLLVTNFNSKTVQLIDIARMTLR